MTLQATTTDGVIPLVARTDAVADGSCDTPSRLSACIPGSRTGVVENSQGTKFFALCRVFFEGTPEGWFDDIAVIAQDSSDGQTCMWGTNGFAPPYSGAALVEPGSPDDQGLWASPAELATIGCRHCHDGNGLVVTPWIRQYLPSLPPDVVMDLIWADELGQHEPSWLGSPLWTHPEAAPCRACHELPKTVACFFGPEATGRRPDPKLSLLLHGFPTDRWMDDFDPAVLAARPGGEAAWEAEFGAAADRLMDCCHTNSPDCWSAHSPANAAYGRPAQPTRRPAEADQPSLDSQRHRAGRF